MRARAIKALGDQALDPIVKMQTCIRYEIDYHWAKDALTTLCTRANMMEFEEASKLDIATTFIIARVREQLAKTSVPGGSEILVAKEIEEITKVKMRMSNPPV